MTTLPSPPSPARSRNIIARHWRGEYPFSVSFWVFGVLASVATAIAILVLLNRIAGSDKGYDPAAVFAVMVGSWLFTGVLTGWQVTGVWRSGRRIMLERRAAGRGSFWVTIGCGIAILGTISFVRQFVFTGVPQIGEAGKIAILGDPDIAAYAIRTMRDGTELEISGGIKYGLDRDLRAALDASPAIAVVHLDSPGGRLGEARKVYETIRDHGLLTYVPHMCNSACTMVFLAGRERLLGASGVLGFHSAFYPVGASTVDEQAAFFRSKGIDEAFVRRVIATPNDDMWFPTAPELEAAGVVTGEVPGDRFAISGLGPDVTPDVMKRQVLDHIPMVSALSQADPVAFEALVATMYAKYVAGATYADTVGALTPAMGAALRAYLPLAADRPLRAFVYLSLDAMRSTVDQDPRACYASGEADDAVGADLFGKERMRRLFPVVTEVLWTSDPGHALAPEARAAAGAKLEEIVADLPVRRPAADEPVSPADEEAFCRARLAAWERVDALGDAATPIFRLMLERMRDGRGVFDGD